MFLSYATEWLVVAVGGLGLLLGILLGRSWGVRRRIESAVQDAETSARTDLQTGLWNRRGFEDRYNRSRDGRRREKLGRRREQGATFKSAEGGRKNIKGENA